MAQKSRALIKAQFLNGMKPNQEEFADMIDSALNKSDDGITAVAGKIGIATNDPKATLHVFDNGSGDPVGPGITSATLMVGNQSSHNLSMDNNEIQAKNGANASTFLLQREGGDVRFFDAPVSEEGKVVLKATGRIGVGTTNPSGKLHINTTTNDFIVANDGKVGVATTSPQALLHVYTGNTDLVNVSSKNAAFMVGDADAQNLSMDNNEIMSKSGLTGTTLYLNRQGGNVQVGASVIGSSDKTLKKEIKPLKAGLSEVLKLKPVSFIWKNDPENDLKFGFIAQDVEKVLNDVVYRNEKTATKGIAYTEIIPVLTGAIQEQQKQIESLEARLAKLEKLISKK